MQKIAIKDESDFFLYINLLRSLLNSKLSKHAYDSDSLASYDVMLFSREILRQISNVEDEPMRGIGKRVFESYNIDNINDYRIKLLIDKFYIYYSLEEFKEWPKDRKERFLLAYTAPLIISEQLIDAYIHTIESGN